MLDRTTTLFSHVKPNDTAFVRGAGLGQKIGLPEFRHNVRLP